MKYLYKISVVLLVIFLVGCHQKSLEVSSCINHCYAVEKVCNSHCNKSCQQCSVCSTTKARHSYSKYKHQQCIKGSRIARDLQSYRDPLKCKKNTCDCSSDLNICIQSCNGVIHKRLQVKPTCC